MNAQPIKLGIELSDVQDVAQTAGLKALEGLTLGSADLAAYISPGVGTIARKTLGIDPIQEIQDMALVSDLTKLTGIKVSDFADRLRDMAATSIQFGLAGAGRGALVGGPQGAAAGGTLGALVGAGVGAIGAENIRAGINTLLPDAYKDSAVLQNVGHLGYFGGGVLAPGGASEQVMKLAKTIPQMVGISSGIGGGIGLVGSLPQVEQAGNAMEGVGIAATNTAVGAAFGAASVPVGMAFAKVGNKAGNLLKQAQNKVNSFLNDISEIQRTGTMRDLRGVQQSRDNMVQAQQNAQAMQMQAMRAAEAQRQTQAANFNRVQQGLVKTQQEAGRVVQLAEAGIAENVVDNLLAAQKGLTAKALDGDFQAVTEAQQRAANEIPRAFFDDLDATLEQKQAMQEASNEIQVKLLTTDAKETILKDFDMPSFVAYIDKMVSDEFAIEAIRMQELRAVRENAGNYFKEAAQRLLIDNVVNAYRVKMEQIKRIDDYFRAKESLDQTPTPKESKIAEEIKAFESELSDLEAVKARLNQAYKKGDTGEISKVVQENADIIDEMKAVHGDDLAGLEDDSILAIGLEDEIDAVKGLIKERKTTAESELMDIKRQKLNAFRKRYGTDDETEAMLQAERQRLAQEAEGERAEYLKVIKESAEIARDAAQRQMRIKLKRAEQPTNVSIIDRGLPKPSTKGGRPRKVAKNADVAIKIETGGTKTDSFSDTPTYVKEAVLDGVVYKMDGESLTVETPTDEMVKFVEETTDNYNTVFDDAFKAIADWNAPVPETIEERAFRMLGESTATKPADGATPQVEAPKAAPTIKRLKSKITVDFGDEGKITFNKPKGYETTSDERLIEIARERLDKQKPASQVETPRAVSSLMDKAKAAQAKKGAASKTLDDIIVPIVSKIEAMKNLAEPLRKVFVSKLNTLRAARHGLNLELSRFVGYVNRAAGTNFKDYGSLAKYLDNQANANLNYPTERYQEILKETNPELYKIGAAVKEYFINNGKHGVKGEQNLGELLGMQFGDTQEVYFPRMVKDIKKLREAMEAESLMAGANPKETGLKEELAKELDRSDSVLDEDLVTNNFLERKFKYIPDKYRDMYMSSGDALMAKIGDFQKQKAEYDFFDGTLDRNAGMSNKLVDLVKTKANEAGVELADEDLGEIVRGLHPVFDKIPSNDPFIKALRAVQGLSMARLLSGFGSAVTQITSTPRLMTAYFDKIGGIQDFFQVMAFLPKQLRSGFLDAVKSTDIINDLMYMDRADGMLKVIDKFSRIATLPIKKATELFESPLALGTAFKSFHREASLYKQGKAKAEFVEFADMNFGDDAERLINKFGGADFGKINYDEDVAKVAFTMAARKANMVYGKMDLSVSGARQIRSAGDFVAQNITRLNSYVNLGFDTLKRNVVGEARQGRPEVAFKNALSILMADVVEMHLRMAAVGIGAASIAATAGLPQDEQIGTVRMARENAKEQTGFDSYIGKRLPLVGPLARYMPNIIDVPALLSGDLEGGFLTAEEEKSQVHKDVLMLLVDTVLFKGLSSEARTIEDTFKAGREGIRRDGAAGLLNVFDPVANRSSKNIPLKWVGELGYNVAEPLARKQMSNATYQIQKKYLDEQEKGRPDKVIDKQERVINAAAEYGINPKEILTKKVNGVAVADSLTSRGRYQRDWLKQKMGE
jgi:hypothetical protein